MYFKTVQSPVPRPLTLSLGSPPLTAEWYGLAYHAGCMQLACMCFKLMHLYSTKHVLSQDAGCLVISL